MMGEQQNEIEQRNEVEEENARDKTVLRRDQVKNERADAGDRLAQAEAMLAQKAVLQEIIARAFAAERFNRQAEDEQAAINAVAPPGERRAGRVKGYHDPDADPKQECDENNLTEQEKAMQTFRAMRDHG